MASKGRIYRTFEQDGWEILVGKGAHDNDTLTFDVAEPHDMWLHVRGHPGSHVLIRAQEGVEMPTTVIRRAAELAAGYSKVGTSRRKVEVHYCQAADVRKRRGAPAGEVELTRWKSIKVYPKADEA